MYVFQPTQRAAFRKLVTVGGVFSPGECENIRELFTNPQLAGIKEDGAKVLELRKSKIHWIYWSEEYRWLFGRLEEASRKVNELFYGFQLSGFYEALQLTKYETGDHYTWHEDSTAPKFTTRKLSLVLQLTPREEYTGGELIVFPDELGSTDIGSVTFFPSYLTHKVSPVTTGERFSLVSWITGEPFH